MKTRFDGVWIDFRTPIVMGVLICSSAAMADQCYNEVNNGRPHGYYECDNSSGSNGGDQNKNNRGQSNSSNSGQAASAIGGALIEMQKNSDAKTDAQMEALDRQWESFTKERAQKEAEAKAEQERNRNIKNGVQASLVYRCRFDALAGHRVTDWFGIWEADKRRGYIVAAQPNNSAAQWVKSSGVPTKGNFYITLPDKVVVTITANGWGITSIDRIANKNSLYGEVSPEKSKAGGGCVYLKDRPSEKEERLLEISN